jgi:hypothetical protein
MGAAKTPLPLLNRRDADAIVMDEDGPPDR